jgi:NAD(P)-dependent dehydrogenase (short-subunit alcohol dehydrogenase family)
MRPSGPGAGVPRCGRRRDLTTPIEEEAFMSEPELSGKTALVAGAAHGIGRATCVALARAGAAIVCTDIDAAGAEATAAAVEAAGGRALARRTDVTRLDDARADVAAAQARFGAVDVLVYAAAAQDPSATVVELDVAWWDRTLAVNLTGAMLAAKAVLPGMIERRGGSIIFIASQLGRVGHPGRPAYCATKGALIQLARAMAADHAAQGIRVNTLSPGPVETERLAARYGSLQAARRAIADRQLLGRLARPEEIGRAALFLASPASSFMTGADLLVDGGYTAT